MYEIEGRTWIGLKKSKYPHSLMNKARALTENQNKRGGVILSYISLIISIIGSLFITNRVLNYIGDYNYGLYSFVNSIVAWLNVLSSSLIASYLRFTAIESKENDGNIGRTNSLYFKMLLTLGSGILGVGIFILCMLYFGHVTFAKYSWDDCQLIYLLGLLAVINVSITLPSTIFTQYIHYKKQFIFEKTVSIIVTILSFLFHFVIAYFTRNIIFIALYSVVSTIFVLLVQFTFCKKKLAIQFGHAPIRENSLLLRSIFLFSSIMLLNSIVDQINSHVDKTLLGIYSIPENITIYQMGQMFNGYLATLVVAVSSVFVPQIHDLCAKNDKKNVDAVFLRVSRLQGIIVVFVAFGFVACGYDFILWWLGETRIYAYYVGAVLMILSIMPQSVKLALEIQKAQNKHKFRSFLYFGIALINVALSILFLNIFPSKYSVFACLLGTVIASLICQVVAMNIYNKFVMKLPMEKHWLQLGKQILFGILSVGLAYSCKFFLLSAIPSLLFKFILEGTVYVLAYGILLMMFDRKFIFGVIRK